MNIKNLCQSFLLIEKNNSLFAKYNTSELPLWSLVRFPIWSSILLVQKLELTQAWSSYRDKSILSKMLPGLNLIKGTIRRNTFIGLKENDFLFLGIGQREKVKNQYFDIYMDYLIRELSDYKILSMIKTGGHHFNPLPFENYKYFDALNLKTLIKGKLSRKDDEIILKLKEILNIIINYFDLKINYSKVIDDLYFDKVFNFIQYREAFRRILDKVKPKIIFENDHYGIKSIAVNVVANRLNIPTVEIQHGTINNYHIGYNYQNLGKNETVSFLPKYIFMFGEYWKRNCKLPISEKNKIVTGFPHFEEKRKMTSHIKKNAKQILVISQALVGEALSNLIFDLAKKLTNGFTIVYKLHPAEYHNWQGRYIQLLKLPTITIVDPSSSKTLYEYFAESTYQIGVFSTALYEGLAYNLKTFVVNLPGHEYLYDLIEAKYVILVKSADDIISNLNPDRQNIDQISNDLWEENALKNMHHAINEILLKNQNRDTINKEPR